MTRYRGNDQVKMGFYWNPSQWDIVTIPKGGGVLPGGDDVGYMRFPLLLVILLGPLVGAAYVIFLPFIGFAMLFGFAGKKLLAAARRALGGRFADDEGLVRQKR
jgi:hypothetical protein